jgi:hypothetical protein
MKKFIVLFGLLGLVGVCFAGNPISVPKTYVGTSVVITNLDNSPREISGIDLRFVTNMTGTITCNRIRGSATNLWLSQSITAVTSVGIMRDSFAGLWLNKNDIFYITLPGMSSNIIINQESSDGR